MKKSTLIALTLTASFVASPLYALGETRLESKVRGGLEYRIHMMETGRDSVMEQLRADIQSTNKAQSMFFAKNDAAIDLPKGIEKRLEDGKDLPKGIAKKLFPNGIGTTTDSNDTTAPIIFAVRQSTGTSTADVRWFTGERATSSIRFGTTTALSSTVSAGTPTGFRHSAHLTGLLPDTLYYYAIVATDASGNTRQSATASFSTDPIQPNEQDGTAPRIVFSLTTNIDDDKARLIFVTNEGTRASIFLSTTTPVATAVPLIIKNDLSFFHDARIDGLSSSTTYYYIVRTTDASGNTAESTSSFTTRSD